MTKFRFFTAVLALVTVFMTGTLYLNSQNLVFADNFRQIDEISPISFAKYGDNGVFIECDLPDPEWSIEVFDGNVKIVCKTSSAVYLSERPTISPVLPNVVETIPAIQIESDEPDLFDDLPAEIESYIPQRDPDEPMIDPIP